MPQASKPQKRSTSMGDRSPKDNQKKTGQKQAKAGAADQQKKQDAATKAGVAKKK
jgi:hypothetical protein